MHEERQKRVHTMVLGTIVRPRMRFIGPDAFYSQRRDRSKETATG